MDKLERLPEWRDLPNVWSGGVGPKLLEITWSVQGRSSARAPDNLYEWLIANNRYPQHRGRSAALRFIQEQFDEITRLTEALRLIGMIFERADESDGEKVRKAYRLVCQTLVARSSGKAGSDD